MPLTLLISMLWKTKIRLILGVFFLVLPYRLYGQSSLTILDIDPTDAPVVRASIVAVNTGGEAMTALSSSDLRINDNGKMRSVMDVQCNEAPNDVPFSLVVSFDISTSMGSMPRPGQTRLEIAKAAATAWISGIHVSNWECSISGFNSRTFILQDFTRDHLRLNSAIDRLKLNGNNGPDPLLTRSPGGGLYLTASGHYRRRMLLLLTDDEFGWNNGSAADIAAASASGTSVYCLVVGRRATDELRQIAERSGGSLYDNISSVDEARRIVGEILRDLGIPLAPYCTVSWNIGNECDMDHIAIVAIPGADVSTSISYSVPTDSLPKLRIDPSQIDFGPVPPGQMVDTTVTLVVLRGRITVRDVISDNPRFSVVSPSPFSVTSLNQGESLAVRLRFLPSDSGYTFARFDIESDDCGQQPIVASGGFPGKVSNARFLKVVAPNGGERLAVGDTFGIAWSGLLPKKAARLEYSYDAGRTWQQVSDRATANRLIWTVPDTPSDSCLVRVTQILTDIPVLLDKSPEHPQSDGGFSASGGVVAAKRTFYKSDGYVDHEEIGIWNAFTGKVARIVQGPGTALFIAGLNPQRNLIAVGFTYDTIEIRDVDTWALIRSVAIPYHAMQGSTALRLLRFDAAWNKLLITWSTSATGSSACDTTRVIDMATGSEVQKFVPACGVVSADFSPDGTRAVFGRSDGVIEIWDATTGIRIDTIAAFIAINGSTVGPQFDGMGGRIVAWGENIDSTQTKRELRDSVKIWDVATTACVMAFPTDRSVQYLQISPDGRRIVECNGVQSGPANVWNITGAPYVERRLGKNIDHAMFSRDGHRICVFEHHDAASTDAADAIWYLDDPPSEIDTSDAFWSIVTPQAASSDVDFGDVVVGDYKDSVVTRFITNTGDVPIHIEDLQIAGGSANGFTVLSRLQPARLAARDSIPVEFRFEPPALGSYIGTVQVGTSTKPLTVTLRGRGVAPQAEVGTTLVDFGALEIGDTKEIELPVALKNIGTSPLTVRTTTQGGPDIVQFSTTMGTAPAALQVGDVYPLKLRFAPQFIGRTSGSVVIDFDGPGSPAVIQLLGQGLGGEIVVADDSGSPGSHVRIPLRLVGPRNYIEKSPATSFLATFRFDKHVLIPSPPFTTVATSDRYRTVELKASWDGRSEVLAELPFTVAIGNVDSTTIELRSFSWLDKEGGSVPLDIRTTDGLFRVTELCPDGGTRLIALGNIALKEARPDPATSTVTIEYDLVERGYSKVFLTDMLGSEMMCSIQEDASPGNHVASFDVSALPSGLYYYTLQTPTQRITRMLSIIR